jgi:hypothetical protein
MKYILFAFLIFATAAHAQNSNAQYTKTQNGLLNGATVFTVEFWVKITDNHSSDVYWQRPYLFGNETNGNNSGDFGITTNGGYIGMFEGISSLNTDQQFLSNSVRINDNIWHHIAAVNNGQTVNLFVDGNVVGSLVSGRGVTTNIAPLTIGAATLDYAFAGNNAGNVNFISQSVFDAIRISNNARYTSNFTPPQTLPSDANSVAAFQIGNQNFSSQSLDPNKVVLFEPNEAIINNAAQQAMLMINDSTSSLGKILLGKKNWSFKNDIYIHFTENGTNKVQYFKPEEIKGFQMGNSYYEPKFLGQGGAVNTTSKKTIVKRLTPDGSKMAMYEYQDHSSTKNGQGYVEYKDVTVLFVQLPNTTNDKIYQFSDNKFVPNFDRKVSAIVADKPALAEKIRSKNKDYFYGLITEQLHQNKVWWNIVNEYNQ